MVGGRGGLSISAGFSNGLKGGVGEEAEGEKFQTVVYCAFSIKMQHWLSEESECCEIAARQATENIVRQTVIDRVEAPFQLV